MKFCPKCGAMLLPKHEKGKMVFSCSCGYKDKSKDKVEIKEEIKKQKVSSDVVDEKDSMLPETDAECPKCKNHKAYYWLVQTRAGDEPETKFLKCTKCSHTWRDYN